MSGELVLAKGAKVALHDQRPPRDRGLSLRDYVLSGAPELVAIERELCDARAGDGGGARTTRRRSTATRGRRPSSSTPAATTGAIARSRRCTASAFATARDLDRVAAAPSRAAS